jgi:RNA polymerase sigma-70 factor (ECF subfamily)
VSADCLPLTDRLPGRPEPTPATTVAESGVASAEAIEAQVTRLFEQLRLPVYRHLCLAFGSEAQAEEVTQEAFLRLYQAVRRGEAIVNVRAWVFRVARNLALNQLRHDRYLEPLDDDAWERLSRFREDPAFGPEQALVERERAARVKAGLDRLSPRQRQCLLLRVEGFRYREIAEILGVTMSTVAESLRRGVHKLERQLDGSRD